MCEIVRGRKFILHVFAGEFLTLCKIYREGYQMKNCLGLCCLRFFQLFL